MTTTAGGGRRLPLRLTSIVALLVGLAAAFGAAWGTHSVVHDQEQRLLKERGSELNLVLNSAISTISAGLTSQGEVLRATDGERSAYEHAAQQTVAANTGNQPLSFAWLR